eukprot:TRINITY_DN6433_c0_g2_i1.p1 TRINITY_DN6433_c0_g2~~TRINITY_DN6433_c0_g2_i1.p1  ORF type:complete len:681 (+),score=171.23 TRINITY_DN6433_c0_g2_i1:191-2233(+)
MADNSMGNGTCHAESEAGMTVEMADAENGHLENGFPGVSVDQTALAISKDVEQCDDKPCFKGVSGVQGNEGNEDLGEVGSEEEEDDIEFDEDDEDDDVEGEDDEDDDFDEDDGHEEIVDEDEMLRIEQGHDILHSTFRRKRSRDETAGLLVGGNDILGLGLHDDSSAPSRRSRTVEDLLHFYQGQYDEGESDEDSDWEPQDEMLQWTCVNCTTDNPDLEGQTLCRLCGEHRASGILARGFHCPADQPWEPECKTEVDEVREVGTEDGEVCGEGLASTSSSTAVGYDDRMLLHCEMMKSSPHPERPDRLRAIMGGLAAAGLFPGRCVALPAREIGRKEIEMVHTPRHWDLVESTSEREVSYFTSDTYANQHSALCARLAAGCTVDMAVAIVVGEIKNGLAMVRPPGHHADTKTVMGFCLHNNAAVAARAAQAAGARKVLILDWDVHHGNGTQEIFENDPSVLYISTHRYEQGQFYPGTGGMLEVGSGSGEGFSVNIPWKCGGVGDEDYMAAFQYVVLPISRQFAPDLIIISAGFDAAAGDPLGACEVTPAGYAHMTSMLMSVTQGRVLVVLEGGYNLRSISASVAAVTQALLGDAPSPLTGVAPSDSAMETIAEVCTVQSRYWPGLVIPEVVLKVAVAGETAPSDIPVVAETLPSGLEAETGVAGESHSTIDGEDSSLGSS